MVLIEIAKLVVPFLSMLLLMLAGLVCSAFFLFKQKLGLVVFCLIISTFAWEFLPESYFHFYPLIDTAHSSKFSEAKFSQVKPGMSKQEVVQLIGGRSSNHKDINDDGSLTCERQTEDGQFKYWDFAWLNASVCYDANNLVESTSTLWQYD